jgi:dimethylhistidine N-methyltransferase
VRNESPTLLPQQEDDEFLVSVLEGLRRKQRAIPPKFFYDARGSHLFDMICTTPEYYPTRTETGILERHGEEMAEMAGRSCALIELGCGSATKTPLILRHLDGDASYIPVDICAPQLRQSTQRLQAMFPGLKMQPLCADYHQLPMNAIKRPSGKKSVVFFPGSTIGNCTPDEAVRLLRKVAGIVGTSGGLLIGVDCKKSVETLNAAYNDRAGYTSAFNLNLLIRMKNELGADLNEDQFAHRAYYNEHHGRIEMHLVSRSEQQIRLGKDVFLFRKGETIHTENSYKYSAPEFTRLAHSAGWFLKSTWQDDDAMFNVHYFGLSPVESLKPTL